MVRFHWQNIAQPGQGSLPGLQPTKFQKNSLRFFLVWLVLFVLFLAAAFLVDGSFTTVYLSMQRLEVLSPPSYPGLVTFGFLALLGLVIFWRGISIKSKAAIFIGAVWFLGTGFGFFINARSASIILDASQNTARVVKYSLSIRPEVQTITLNQISSAQVNSVVAAELLTLNLKDGSVISFTPFSSRKGQSQAAQAINNFLAANKIN